MTYFKDMSVCTYFGRGDWACRFMAIGWLESGRPYVKGTVNPGLLQKLIELRREFGEIGFPGTMFRGLHGCTLCARGYDAPLMLLESHINLFIPAEGFVYVAPGRIDHYIETHGYAPPEYFVEAVMNCPSPSSQSFRDAMARANRGYDAPLYQEGAWP
jgi:hypothetical protein